MKVSANQTITTTHTVVCVWEDSVERTAKKTEVKSLLNFSI